MGLLRNASGLIIPSAAIGGSGRADDPEFHIRRLEHFGKGMGINLTSTYPSFSGKDLNTYGDGQTYPDGQIGENLKFNSHDEGLHLPTGHMEAAHEAVYDHTSGGMQELRNGALDELSHRSPYRTYVVADPPGHWDPNKFHGVLVKSTSDGRDHARGWGHKEASEDTYADAMKGVSSRFQDFNSNRTGTPANISNLVSKVINIPNERLIRATRAMFPHKLSSQFLGVSHLYGDFDDKDLHDQVDLKTGNWAKIDPEEYFPN